jgi:hypothetical protein
MSPNPLGSFHPYYIGEAVVFSIVGWTILILFILQFLAEKRHKERAGKVHRLFHVCGMIMGTALVFTAIDPQGVFGVIRWEVILLVKDIGTTAVGYIPLSQWTLASITIFAQQLGSSSFGLIRHIEDHSGKYCAGMSLLNLTITVITDEIAIQANRTYARGFQLLYLSLSFFVAMLMLVYTFVKLLQMKAQTADVVLRPNEKVFNCSDYFSPQTRRIRYAALVFLFASMMTLQGGISIILYPSELSADQVPRDPLKVQVFYWILPFWFGIFTCLMGAWLPLNHLGCCNCKQPKSGIGSTNVQNNPKSTVSQV